MPTSTPRPRRRARTPLQDGRFRRSHALVVGVNRYSTAAATAADALPDLTTPVADALALAQRLRELGYCVVTLTGEAATAERILGQIARFRRVVGKAKGRDRFLFYFAGHGIALAAPDDKGLPRGYVVTYGVTRADRSGLLDMAVLRAALEGTEASPMSAHHALVVLDCCFAGAFRQASAREVGGFGGRLYDSQLRHFTERPAWQMLCSAAPDQIALDVVDGLTLGTRGAAEGAHSPFAAALLRGLGGDADARFADPDGQLRGDGVITASELYLYLRRDVGAAAGRQGHSQTPELWPGRAHDGGEFVFLVGPLHTAVDPDVEEANNPYRGLRPYEKKDAAIFFGRDRATADLVACVRQRPLTAVLGASGSGKSSLVAAGLSPRLAAEPDPARGEAPFVLVGPFRPGAAPLLSLAIALAEAAPRLAAAAVDPKKLARELLERPADLATLLTAWTELGAGPPRRHVALLIDQTEELWTLGRGGDAERKAFVAERKAFLNALAHVTAAASAVPPARLRVVLTLRSDFEAAIVPRATEAIAWDQVSPEVWRRARFPLAAMTPDEMRAVMARAAATAAVYFEPDHLMDDILDDVRGMPGALPLLSVTLSALYGACVKRRRQEHSTDRSLRKEDYTAMRGIAGAIGAQAEAAYQSFAPPETAATVNDGARPAVSTTEAAGADAARAGATRNQETLRRLLLRMVPVGGEVVRRRVRQAEMEMESDEESKRVETVKARLVDLRLLTADKDAGESFVEPAHDALLTAWLRLTAWRNAEATWLPLHRNLTATAFEHQAHHTAEATRPSLWRGEPLAVAAKKRREEPLLFCRAEAKLLDDSLRWKWARWAGGLALVAGAIGASLSIALIQRDLAKSEADRATEGEARTLAAQAADTLRTDPQRSLDLAVRAWETRPVREAERAIRAALSQARLRGVLAPDHGALRLATFGASGERILLVGEDGLSLWSTTPVAELARSVNSGVTHALLADDGEQALALRTAAGIAELWLVGRDTPEWTYPHAVHIQRGPDGHLRVVIEDGDATGKALRTRVHDVETASDIGTFEGRFAAMSPDGRRIVVARPELIVLPVEASDEPQGGTPLASRAKEKDPCARAQMTWDPERDPVDDECGLVTSSSDLFFSGELALRLTPSSRLLPALSLPASTHGASAIGGSRTFHWMNIDAPPRLLPDDVETTALFGPDGFMFLGVDAAGLRLWRVGIGRDDIAPQPTTLAGPRGEVLSAAWSPANALVAAGSRDRTASVWARPANAAERSVPLVTTLHHDAAVQSVVFHPREPLLLTAAADGRAFLWRSGTWQSAAADGSVPPRDLAPFPAGTATHATVDPGRCTRPADQKAQRSARPDGHLIATGDPNGEIRLCDLRNGEAKGTFFGHTSAISTLRWADDRFLVSGDALGIVRVWDTEAAVELFVEAGVGARVTDAVLAPDRRSIAVLAARPSPTLGPRVLRWSRIEFLGALAEAELLTAAREQLKIQ